MAKFITIIVFVFSLYTPTLVKWLGYVQCIAITENSNDWCSCQLSNVLTTDFSSDALPSASINNLQLEDKYVPLQTTIQFCLPALKPLLFSSKQQQLKGILFADGVFRPPCI